MAVSIIMAVMSFRMLAAIQAHSTRNINNGKEMSMSAKLLLFVIVALTVITVKADVIEGPCIVIDLTSLHRIGFEIIVSAAASIVGGTLLRHLGKKNWHVKGNWKDPEEISEDDLKSIGIRVKEVRAVFRSAVRTAYDKVEGLLAEGWKQDMIFSLLENDECLMARCTGIPIECLMGELMAELGRDLELRLNNVLCDFKCVFNAAYDGMANDWLRKDALIANRNAQIFALKLFWLKIKKVFLPKHSLPYYDSTSRCIRSAGDYHRGDFRYLMYVSRWMSLCGSLIDLILEQNANLKSRCRGVEKKKLLDSLQIECPDNYCGAYSLEKGTESTAFNVIHVTTLFAHNKESNVSTHMPDTNVPLFLRVWSISLAERDVLIYTGRSVIIGRSHSADVHVPYADVAGRHVELSVTDNRLLVRVLSRFGAVVDGKTLWQNEVAEVSEGSVILVGCHMKAVVSMVTTLDPRQFE